MGQPRASWTGVIQFGLVPIGVQLVAMTADPEPEFVSVHASCLAPVRQDRVCTKCAHTLGSVEMVKAVKSGNDYIRVTEDELDALATPSRGVVKIEQFESGHSRLFAQLEQVERAYWVIPASPEDTPAFAVFREVLLGVPAPGRARCHLVGRGKIAFRSRERLAAIARDGDQVVLYALHFASEIREAPASITAAVRTEDVAAGLQLAASLTGRPGTPDAEPVDEYTERLQALVRTKCARPPASTMDLGKQLAESVKRERRRVRRAA